MMERTAFTWLLVVTVLLRPADTQNAVPGTVLNCCEGDVLLLLDSSGSVSSYEFSRLLGFLSDLLRPFLLGRGQVRVGLLQVGTEPQLEFGLDAHGAQTALQEALRGTRQLLGDTNTVEALQLAQRLLARPPGAGDGPPRVLVWLTDGVGPGAVEGPMATLRQEGVSVLAVSTGHGNYQVLRRVVTPPAETHLYFVDIDDISIITEDLRDAIIELIRAERLQVRDVTSRSAVLQWRPVLSGGLGRYELRYGAVWSGSGSNAGLSAGSGRFSSLSLPGDASWTELTQLQPDTPYTAWLIPELFKSLSVSFTTLPEVLSPAVVTVSESGADRVRVSWGPLQPGRVQRYSVEYGAIPRGEVRTVTLSGRQNSTVLTRLQPDTQYLVTVSALYSSGQERAMSVRACTQEVLPGLADLQLTPVGRDSVQVRWRGREAGVQGYWVSWEGGSHTSSSSMHLPPSSLSTLLTHLKPASRVCVSPVYRTARGEGLCCTTHT